MDLEKRIELITQEPIEEVITIEDLRNLLEINNRVSAYDGFEPSGLLHLASGLMRAIKIEDLQKAGINFILLVADWHGWLNNKMGGDLEKIRRVGEYIVEGWKACGVDMNKVKVLYDSKDLKNKQDYWEGVVKIAKEVTVKRLMRAGTIMGRTEAEMQKASFVLYPILQAWDPFYIGADILQLGMDQRSATMLSRELAPRIDGSIRVCLHHHLLAGLQGAKAGRMGQELSDVKMSKSKASSCIFIHDSKEEISKKIKKAFCPEKIAEGNPVLEMWRYIIFRKFDDYIIKRPAKFGGKLEVQSYDELEKYYTGGELHPLDLKNSTVEVLNDVIAPVRKRFEKGKAKELYEFVKAETEKKGIEKEKPKAEKKQLAEYNKEELANIARVEKKIKDSGIKAEIIKHLDTAVTSLNTHLRLFKCTPGEVLKCLCLVSEGKPLVVVASGDVRIDMKKLAKASGMKEPRLASKDELRTLFNRFPGAVDAITVPKKIPVFMDKKLLEKEEVIGSAGSARAGLRIKPEDVLKCVDAKVADLAE